MIKVVLPILCTESSPVPAWITVRCSCGHLFCQTGQPQKNGEIVIIRFLIRVVLYWSNGIQEKERSYVTGQKGQSGYCCK